MSAIRHAVPLALAFALVLVPAPPARAAGAVLDSAGVLASGSADAAAWWMRPGLPAWTPGAEQGGGFPRVFAGHAIGGWGIEDSLRAPVLRPWPGAAGAVAPLAWAGELRLRGPAGAAWSGPGTALASLGAVDGPREPGARGRASLFSLARGSSAEERNALRLVQRDSARTIVAEVAEWTRGGSGEWRTSGTHRYGAGLSAPWRQARLEGAFGHTGSAGSVTSGEEESVTGFAGHARVIAPVARGEGRLEAGRELDHRDSFGGVMSPGRRDAQQAWVAASWTRAHGGGASGAGARFARSEVVQSVPAIGRAEWADDAWWLAARHERSLGPGRIAVALGAGSSSAAGSLGPAPSLVWEGSLRGAAVRLAAGRSVTPVFSDLAPGVAAFVQSAWTAGGDLELGSAARRLAVGGLVGRTTDRAVVARLPIASWWLREGATRDAEPWDFALGTIAASWSGAPGALAAEAHALARAASAAQPAVDPAWGARSSAEGRHRFFAGDLEVRLRGEAAWVGERESEALVPRRLPGYATFGAALVFVLADVTVVADLRGLEDRRRPEVWIHPLTRVEALGPGREFRVTVHWKLFD